MKKNSTKGKVTGKTTDVIVVKNSEKKVISYLTKKGVKLKRVNGAYSEAPLSEFAAVKRLRSEDNLVLTTNEQIVQEGLYFYPENKQLIFDANSCAKVYDELVKMFGADVEKLVSKMENVQIDDSILYVFDTYDATVLEYVLHPKDEKQSYFHIQPTLKTTRTAYRPVTSVTEGVEIITKFVTKLLNDKVMMFSTREKQLSHDQLSTIFLLKDVTLQCTYATVNDLVSRCENLTLVPVVSNFIYAITQSKQHHSKDDASILLNVPEDKLNLIIGTKGKNAATLSKRLNNRKVTFAEFL